MLQVFSDEKLDFSAGFQVLHATYLVETLLHKLQRRKCIFHITFFAKNDHLCVPVGTPDKLRYRYLLAREAIIEHLSKNGPVLGSGQWIKRFSSYRSSDFRAYLQTSGAYFFMCHDGAFAESSIAKYMMEEDSHDESETRTADSDTAGNEKIDKERWVDTSLLKQALPCRVALRRMIYQFMDYGYNVALINTLEFRDSKASLPKC